MIRCKMTVDSVSVTNTKEPVVFDIAEMTSHDVTVLILFVWFGWDVPSTRPERDFNNRVAKVCIQHLSSWLLMLLNLGLRVLVMILGLVISLVVRLERS